MISTLDFRAQRIDKRRINFQLCYSMTSREKMLELAERFFWYANGFLNERFCTRWKFGNRTVSADKIPALLSVENKKATEFYAEAFVRSDIVFNQKTLSDANKMNQNLLGFGFDDFFLAPDYREEFARFFAQVPREAMKDALLEWFALPNRVERGKIICFDAECSFSGEEYHFCKGYYYGEMYVSVMAFCLGSETSAVADDLCAFAAEIAGSYENCNATITLAPWISLETCSPHLIYFPQPTNIPTVVNGVTFLPSEYYRYAYLCGAEWGNVLSAKLLERLPPQGLEAANPAAIEVKLLPNGAASVKLRKDIRETDVADLAEVKRLLYPALYPGERRVEKKYLTTDGRFCTALPRRHWERVPIFPEEIIETEDAIIYRYCESLKVNDAAERHTDESEHTP